jgi:hypothetical protein
MPRIGWALAAIWLVSAPGSAGEAPADVPPPRSAKPAIVVDRDTQLGGGIAFGGPIGAMASLRILHGLGADVRDHGERVKAVCAVPVPHCAQGFVVGLDVGTGGGRVSLGFGARARVEEEDFRGAVAAGLRVSLARTWGAPVGTEPGLTYVGPELELSVLRVSLTLGTLWRVSGTAGASVVLSWGLGVGL